ncbi:peptide chain release factor N(5)-glutamine methyltransferase [Staphylococcus epidermidis]
MVNYKEKFAEAKTIAINEGFESTRAEWLFLDVFGWSKTDYLIHKDEQMSLTSINKLDKALDRMVTGEPIQYIVGFQSFYGYQFKVNQHCLIPRPETEEVMLHFLELCKKTDTIADIGTGSGAIAITLKLLQPELNVIATDLYEGALSVAKQNASHYHQNIQFLRGNALKPLIEKDIKLDGLISNPPYIGHSEIIDMESTVLNYEPHHALFAEKNGFAIYESILEDLPFVMKQGGHVVFEIGYQQGDILKRMVQDLYPEKEVEIFKDINGNQRILSIIW